MATITALKFDTAEGADEMEGALQGLQQVAEFPAVIHARVAQLPGKLRVLGGGGQ